MEYQKRVNNLALPFMSESELRGESRPTLLEVMRRYAPTYRQFLGSVGARRNSSGIDWEWEALQVRRVDGGEGVGVVDLDDLRQEMALSLFSQLGSDRAVVRLTALGASRTAMGRMLRKRVDNSITDLDSLIGEGEIVEPDNLPLLDRLRANPCGVLNEVIPKGAIPPELDRGDFRARVVACLELYLTGRANLADAMSQVNLRGARRVVRRVIDALTYQRELPIIQEIKRRVCPSAFAQAVSAPGGRAARRVGRWGILSLYKLGDSWRVGVPRVSIGNPSLDCAGVSDRLPVVRVMGWVTGEVRPKWSVLGEPTVRKPGASFVVSCRLMGHYSRVPVRESVKPVAIDVRRVRPPVVRVDCPRVDNDLDRALSIARSCCVVSPVLASSVSCPLGAAYMMRLARMSSAAADQWLESFMGAPRVDRATVVSVSPCSW